MKNMLLVPWQSPVLTSNRLFRIIAEAVDRTLPKKRLSWKDFLAVVAEERNLVLVSKGESKRGPLPVSIYVENVEGEKVGIKIMFPYCGAPQEQQDRILKNYLSKIGLKLPVRAGSAISEVVLPFAPVEVRSGIDGGNGNGQKSFICPEEEVIKVT